MTPSAALADRNPQADRAGPGDDVLLAAISRRDASAFRLVVERYGSVPYRIALRMLASRADAEDIAQEALLRLWRMADRAIQIRSVPGWLQTVSTNICLDRLRQRQRRGEAAELPVDLVDAAPGADASLVQAQAATAAQQAIARLPDRQRAAIVLSYYEDLSNAEAATAMSMTIKGFESLLFRARAALRQALANVQRGQPQEGDDAHV